MVKFEACKAISNQGDAEIADRDSYYVGIVLDNGKGDVTATVTDGDGELLDFVSLIVQLHGLEKSHNVPIPVLASNGINIALSDQTATWIVYYAEQVGGHKHV